MRRFVPFLVTLVLAVATLASPVASQEQPPLSDLRRDRADLVRRIAELTDRSARARAAAESAAQRRVLAGLALDVARREYARHAVGAYVDGMKEPERDRIRVEFWADVAAESDRLALLELQRATRAAEAERASAERSIADAEQAAATLEVARQQLETTITARVKADEEAARARRAAAAQAQVGRAVRSTRGQSALMGQFPFGPVSGIPAGLVSTGQVLEGRASWYGPGFDGRPTASGAIFDQYGWTVAHRTLPLGTILLISRGDRSVLALVNDRGPFVGGRILDLSKGVAEALGTIQAGVASVRAEILVPA